MCGILAVLPKSKQSSSELLITAQIQSKLLTHRGPDESGHWVDPLSGAILCHERLAIIDLETGRQPIKGFGKAHVIHNGEIYNHLELKKKLKNTQALQGHSDSEIIVRLYEEMGVKAIDSFDGDFAFVVSDGDTFWVGRDPIGVKPLFYGTDGEANLWFASEIKALEAVCLEIQEFPPGHYFTPELGMVRYFKAPWYEGRRGKTAAIELRGSLERAVNKRLMSDVPVGVLLSGGLDSSLVSAIAARTMKKQGLKLKSFSVGLKKDSSDLIRAREVADFIGTEHHEVIFSVEQGISVLRELIGKIESYDVTSIRASTPMYLMSQYIREQGVKVVLSGEGADEIFGGYLYFAHAPNAKEFHEECLRRIKRLHTSDVLRADRSTMGVGIEARVPFLDLDFLQTSMELDPQSKMIDANHMEKYVLRNAFDRPSDPYLPESILWRQKEQFSDGVGYSWIDGLKEFANEQVSDEDFALRSKLWPFNTPMTKEAFLYRKIYSEIFRHPMSERMVKRWVPRWQDYDLDPSGRANGLHKESYHAKVAVEAF